MKRKMKIIKGENDKAVQDLIYFSKSPSRFIFSDKPPRGKKVKNLFKSITFQMVKMFILNLMSVTLLFFVVSNWLLNVEYQYYMIFKVLIGIIASIYMLIFLVTFKRKRSKLFHDFLMANKDLFMKNFYETESVYLGNNVDDEIAYTMLMTLACIHKTFNNCAGRLRILKKFEGSIDYLWRGETDSLIYDKNRYNWDLYHYLLTVQKKNPFCLGEKSREYLETHNKSTSSDGVKSTGWNI